MPASPFCGAVGMRPLPGAGKARPLARRLRPGVRSTKGPGDAEPGRDAEDQVLRLCGPAPKPCRWPAARSPAGDGGLTRTARSLPSRRGGVRSAVTGAAGRVTPSDEAASRVMLRRPGRIPSLPPSQRMRGCPPGRWMFRARQPRGRLPERLRSPQGRVPATGHGRQGPGRPATGRRKGRPPAQDRQGCEPARHAARVLAQASSWVATVPQPSKKPMSRWALQAPAERWRAMAV